MEENIGVGICTIPDFDRGGGSPRHDLSPILRELHAIDAVGVCPCLLCLECQCRDI